MGKLESLIKMFEFEDVNASSKLKNKSHEQIVTTDHINVPGPFSYKFSKNALRAITFVQ